MKIYELITKLQLLDPEKEVWFAGPTWESSDFDWYSDVDILQEYGVVRLVGKD